jgi:exopolysaccharide biosynthesis protein
VKPHHHFLTAEVGADEAINLDCGGSTTMVVRAKVVNLPSDPTGERSVSDAILIFPKSNKKLRPK